VSAWQWLRVRTHSIIKRGHILAVATLAIAGIVVFLGVTLDNRHKREFHQEFRQTAEKTAALLAQRLQTEIRDEINTAKRLGYAYASQTGGALDLFRFYAQQELEQDSSVLAIAIAPEFRLSRLLNHPAQPDAAQTIDQDELARDIAQRSSGQHPTAITHSDHHYITIVHPIISEHTQPAVTGAVALLIDKNRLMADAGLLASSDSAAARLVSVEGLEASVRNLNHVSAQIFFGDPRLVERSPLQWHFAAGESTWQILVAPDRGWDVPAPDQAEYRFSLALGGLALLIPILMASVLIEERNRNIVALKAREANLLELSQRFNLAMEASNIGIWEAAEDGSHLFWDDRAAALHGFEPGDLNCRLDEWHAAIYPEDATTAEVHFFNLILAKQPCTTTYRVSQDGAVRYLQSAGASYRTPDGTIRTTGIVWDVTSEMLRTQTLRDAKEVSEIKNAELELALDELSKREQQLDELSNKLDLALASYNCGIWEYDPVSGVERWDARMCQLYNIPFTDGIIRQQQWFSLIHPEDRAAAKVASATFISGFVQDALVVRVPQPDGTIRYIRSVGQLQTARNGQKKVVGIAFDVTEDALLTAELKAAKTESDAKNAELELAKSRIEHNALHDPLTMLANRRKLDIELDELSKRSQSERQKFAILHLDLDRFKQINDTLGHAAGDAMLVHASQVLARSIRHDDVVARIGGDEFVILAKDGGSSEEMAKLAMRIIAEFRQPIDFEGFSCRCGVSIGIAQASGLNIDARRILVNADIALYRAKGLGRNRFEFFTQNLQAEIVSHKRTADQILAGIDNHEFVTWYQPQFDARTNRLTGVEALIRWNHPHQGILAPDRFLKIADDLNVTASLDQIVLETVLRDQKRWADSGLDIPKVSVNVSSRRLHDENLIETLSDLGIRPGQISFELVESIFLDEHEDTVAANLDQIRALGIDIEIDDFGTGHTSIVGLLKLRPKRLKIDRQLVMPILQSPQERALVRSIIDIARSLGVETVAEGVETMQHAAMLRELGCDLLQGYAFARPLPFDEFTETAWQRWVKAAA
jgi:diguanylate cyclase (GGDEF)-like protein/PAS domain S-box-containing protein